MPTAPLPDLILIVLLLAASAFDLHHRKIPNRLLALGLLAALTVHLCSGNPSHVLTVYLAGFGVGLLMFLPLYLLGGMAAGDVKLMATVGAFLGPSLAFQSSLATYCAGGLLALAIVLCRRRGRAALANVGAILHPMLLRLHGARLPREHAPAASVGGMPYAVAITLGTCAVLWLRHS
ncbi:prepilin peptidase [Massilia sp. PAMC28688]|uniref:A24 family peptidase n=1 Tax=Massilia sp. PAMC28688 TaxID=2861283 RepID=UPI001C638972|nr:prepilin peptidase [Massilia sp. PAMC28688]QYF95035.1 prepilin peptidase [Massilia sp. PAMC28688]